MNVEVKTILCAEKCVEYLFLSDWITFWLWKTTTFVQEKTIEKSQFQENRNENQ